MSALSIKKSKAVELDCLLAHMSCTTGLCAYYTNYVRPTLKAIDLSLTRLKKNLNKSQKKKTYARVSSLLTVVCKFLKYLFSES